MDDLAAWLTARLDEDERVALAVRADDRRWDWAAGDETVGSAGGSYVACGPWGGDVNAEFAAHIARWDPARVLAEVEAKRAILRLAAKVRAWTDGSAGATAGYAAVVISDSLRALALPYRDRAGYRPEWAPQQ